MPNSIRFHSKIWDSGTKKNYPAMLAVAKDKNGITQAVQVTYLDPKTFNKARISTPKRTFGLLKGAAVKINVPVIAQSKSSKIAAQKLPKASSQPIAIAEGVETALSVAAARPDLQVYATLGISNFANFQLNNSGADNNSQKLLICADNDGAKSDTKKMIDSAANKFLNQKIDVGIISPPRAGQDFNDVLKVDGAQVIRNIIDSAVGRDAQSVRDCGSPASKNTKGEIKELAKIYDLVTQEKMKNSAEHKNIKDKVNSLNNVIETSPNSKSPQRFDNSLGDFVKISINPQQQQIIITTREIER